jgi:3-oxoacyl-[acyl-carrier protein] reductase
VLHDAAPRSIIDISSTSGTHGNAGQANYAAGKAAIVGLTKVSCDDLSAFVMICAGVLGDSRGR